MLTQSKRKLWQSKRRLIQSKQRSFVGHAAQIPGVNMKTVSYNTWMPPRSSPMKAEFGTQAIHDAPHPTLLKVTLALSVVFNLGWLYSPLL
jgi:hypothetical protein